jgi:hypothetical protein
MKISFEVTADDLAHFIVSLFFTEKRERQYIRNQNILLSIFLGIVALVTYFVFKNIVGGLVLLIMIPIAADLN